MKFQNEARVLIAVAVSSLAHAFVTHPTTTRAWSPSQPSLPHQCRGNSLHPPLIRTVRSFRLYDALWDRLGLEESDEPRWYVLNCVAGLETLLLEQCRKTCRNMPDAISFVVPTVRTTRSHGPNRMLAEEKVKYVGYVFAKLRMRRRVYEALNGIIEMRSFMGAASFRRNRRMPPVPIPLTEAEVATYGLEELVEQNAKSVDNGSDQIVIVDSAEAEAEAAAMNRVNEEDLKVYRGLKVNDMVKVTKKSQFFDEDGVVRRLKDGQIFVRFSTYGSMFDVWMQPEDVRKLTNAEILAGPSGPQEPITQATLEGRDKRKNKDKERQRPDMNNIRSPQRNRRQDRIAAQFSQENDYRRDNEEAEHEKNWAWYQDQRRKGLKTDNEGRSFRSKPSFEKRNIDKYQRSGGQRERNNGNANREQSGLVASSKENDDFFDSLVADLTKETERDGETHSFSASEVDHSVEDDFFASLMTESADSKTVGNIDEDDKQRRDSMYLNDASGEDDDFFASLLTDDGKFERDFSGSASMKQQSKHPSGATIQQADLDDGEDDDFFLALDRQLEEMSFMPLQESLKKESDAGKKDGNSKRKRVASKVEERVWPQNDDNYDDDESFFLSLEQQFDEFALDTSSIDREPKTSQADSSDGSVKRADERVKPQKGTAMKTTRQSERPAIEKPTRLPNTEADEPIQDFSKLKVADLKAILRERGLKISGTKTELIERLTSS